MKFLKKVGAVIAAGVMAVMLSGCGERVEVPPAHVGKIMTKDGYQETLIPTSKFRLPACWTYCDKLVILDASDKPYTENLEIFIPEDKLKLGVQVKATLSVNPAKTGELFARLPQTPQDSQTSLIESQKIYSTYAQQIIQTEVREYLSKFSIATIASSNEKMNADIAQRLSKAIEARTPFTVRFVGITGLAYPKVITDSQEAAAQRREAIQKEEAELAISKVSLERQLQEARLNRAIEKEKAETEALAQRTLADSVDPRVLELRKLDNQRAWIDKWNGQLPSTTLGDNVPMVNLGK